MSPAEMEDSSSALKAEGSAVALEMDSGGMAVARTEMTETAMLRGALVLLIRNVNGIGERR
jgi:hypothetical protein